MAKCLSRDLRLLTFSCSVLQSSQILLISTFTIQFLLNFRLILLLNLFGFP
jgi:hypothetical protein